VQGWQAEVNQGGGKLGFEPQKCHAEKSTIDPKTHARIARTETNARGASDYYYYSSFLFTLKESVRVKTSVRDIRAFCIFTNELYGCSNFSF
jgi:hypothetical protein